MRCSLLLVAAHATCVTAWAPSPHAAVVRRAASVDRVTTSAAAAAADVDPSSPAPSLSERAVECADDATECDIEEMFALLVGLNSAQQRSSPAPTTLEAISAEARAKSPPAPRPKTFAGLREDARVRAYLDAKSAADDTVARALLASIDRSRQAAKVIDALRAGKGDDAEAAAAAAPRSSNVDGASGASGNDDDDDASCDVVTLVCDDDESKEAAMEAFYGHEAAEYEDIVDNVRRSWKRLEMADRGLSNAQIDAYLGAAARPAGLDSDAAVDAAVAAALDALDAGGDEEVARRDVASAHELIDGPDEAPSHELVKVDADGDPMYLASADFAFVEEPSCIGCGLCVKEAPSTFFMESWNGRARAFSQGADSETAREAARSVCPVSCIHQVSWEELKRLEEERKTQTIKPLSTSQRDSDLNHHYGQDVFNFKCFSNPSRLDEHRSVEGRGVEDSCPKAGCFNCPRFATPGENPAFIAKEAARSAKRAARQRDNLAELGYEGAKGFDL